MRGSLTDERIVKAALEVLARDGLGGVGMRSVARQLRTAPMSLYRHVRDRQALIELLRKRVTAQPPPDGPIVPATTWQESLTQLLLGARAQLRAHVGGVALFDSPTFEQPHALWAVEQALHALTEAGLRPEAAATTAAALWLSVVGSVVAEQSAVAAWPGAELEPAQRPAWAERMRGVATPQAPRVAAALPTWAKLDHEAVFRRGLEAMLAGVAPPRRGPRRSKG